MADYYVIDSRTNWLNIEITHELDIPQPTAGQRFVDTVKIYNLSSQNLTNVGVIPSVVVNGVENQLGRMYLI